MAVVKSNKSNQTGDAIDYGLLGILPQHDHLVALFPVALFVVNLYYIGQCAILEESEEFLFLHLRSL